MEMKESEIEQIEKQIESESVVEDQDDQKKLASKISPIACVVEMLHAVVLSTAVVPPESTVVPPESAVVPPESAVVPPESAVVPPESAVVPPESAVVPPKAVVVLAGGVPQALVLPIAGANVDVVPLNTNVVPSVREVVQSCESDKLLVVPKKFSFCERLDKLFANIARKVFYFDEMMDLASDGPEDCDRSALDQYFQRGADGLVAACNEVDIRVREHYLPILKHLFMAVSDHQKAIRYVCGLKFFERSTPSLRDYYQDFDKDISRILEGISDEAQNSAEDVENLLGFLFMISPKPAIRQLMLHCFEQTRLIPKLIELLAKFPAFLELCVFRPEYKSTQKEPLMFSLFRRFMSSDAAVVRMNEKENRKTLRAVMTSFCRTKCKEAFGIFERTPISKPLLDATVFFKDFLLDHLARGEYVDFLLSAMCDMLAIEKTSECIIKWKKSNGEKTSEESIDPRAVFSLLVEIYLNNYSKIESRDLAAKSIGSLASYLKEKRIILPNLEFLGGKVSTADWSVKYCLTKWISPAVAVYKLEVPRVLFDVLEPSENSKFVLLETSEEVTEDFLKSIFHLGISSVSEALAFVKPETVSKWGKSVSTVLANALLKVVQSTSMQLSVKNVLPLVDNFIALHDASPNGLFANRWVKEHDKRMRKLASLLVVAEAVEIMVMELNPNNGVNQKLTLSLDQMQLLLFYCESLNSFLDRQGALSKSSIVGFQRSAFSPGNPEELVFLLEEITMFSELVHPLMRKLESSPSELVSLYERIKSSSKLVTYNIYGHDLFESLNKESAMPRLTKKDWNIRRAKKSCLPGGAREAKETPVLKKQSDDVRLTDVEQKKKSKDGRAFVKRSRYECRSKSPRKNSCSMLK